MSLSLQQVPAQKYCEMFGDFVIQWRLYDTTGINAWGGPENLPKKHKR